GELEEVAGRPQGPVSEEEACQRHTWSVTADRYPAIEDSRITGRSNSPPGRVSPTVSHGVRVRDSVRQRHREDAASRLGYGGRSFPHHRTARTIRCPYVSFPYRSSGHSRDSSRTSEQSQRMSSPFRAQH